MSICRISHRSSETGPKMAWKSQRNGPLVWLAPMNSVDSRATAITPRPTGSHALIQYHRLRRLLNMVVGCLPSDDHVVDVTLTQARAGDAHELRLLLEFSDGGATHVTHAGAETANKLEDHGLERPAVGYAALDALRDKFGQAVVVGKLALHHALG